MPPGLPGLPTVSLQCRRQRLAEAARVALEEPPSTAVTFCDCLTPLIDGASRSPIHASPMYCASLIAHVGIERTTEGLHLCRCGFTELDAEAGLNAALVAVVREQRRMTRRPPRLRAPGCPMCRRGCRGCRSAG